MKPDQISSHLADGFECDLYAAALRNLTDCDNSLRFNNFAYAMRELVRHVLYRLAPDASVIQCSWYRDEVGNGQITRRQRAVYAVQGGLAGEYIQDTLGIDTAEMHKSLLGAVKNLSKFTHIEPTTFGLSQPAVDAHVADTRSAVQDLFSTIDDCRNEIIRGLWEHIDRAVIDESLRETINAIDELATHHSIEEIETEEIVIAAIDHDTIHFEAAGKIYCELQWGSNSDLRRGDGATSEESFPYTCGLSSPVDDPANVDSDEDGLRVDTSSWRDGYYDECAP